MLISRSSGEPFNHVSISLYESIPSREEPLTTKNIEEGKAVENYICYLVGEARNELTGTHNALVVKKRTRL